MPMKFTDRCIQGLKPTAERYEVWEDNGRGFGLRVSPMGRKTFVYLYRFQGKPRRLSLGVYGRGKDRLSLADAHAAHAVAASKLADGIDPGAEHVEKRNEAREAATVKELVTEYLDKWAKARKRSWAEDERILKLDVLPAWGRRKARDITRRDVIRLLDGIVDRGAPIQANRTLACVRKMFNFAVSRDIVPASPCVAIKAPSAENRRDVVLDEDQLHAFWQGLDRAPMSEGVRLALKLQLLTAQRKGEIVAATWEEFDLKGGWWTIPPGRVKNKLAHRVPLSSQALDVLRQLRGLASGSPWVLPSPTKDTHVRTDSVNKALDASLEGMGLDKLTPHDLRRTAASHMTGMGISRLTVSKILNHAEPGVTAVYDRHSYDTEKRQALEAWARRLEAVITKRQPENVVELPTVSARRA